MSFNNLQLPQLPQTAALVLLLLSLLYLYLCRLSFFPPSIALVLHWRRAEGAVVVLVVCDA